MAIRQIAKEPEMPPAHLYLEDIRELVDAMSAAAEKVEVSLTNEAAIRFTVGERQCDTIADLHQLGTKSRDFALQIKPYEFRIHGTGVLWSDVIGDTVRTLMQTREIRLKSAMKTLLPLWVPLSSLCAFPLIQMFVPAARNKTFLFTYFSCFLFLAVVSVWAQFTHSVVELRYSYEKSPLMKTIKDNASKAIWIVVGVFLTEAAHWLWNHFTKH